MEEPQLDIEMIEMWKLFVNEEEIRIMSNCLLLTQAKERGGSQVIY